MNPAEIAFRIALRRVGAEQAAPILARKRGERELKTVVLSAAIASALRKVADSEPVLGTARYFYEVEEFISQNFGDIIRVAVSKLAKGEVHASCELSIFRPRDLIVISGKGMKDTIELSVEQLIYQALLVALDDYMLLERVNINHLIITLDGVYEAAVKTCVNAAKVAMILRNGDRIK